MSGESSRSPRILGVIPARLASQRLPRKMLRSVAGRPLLAWTVEAARACPQLHELVVAVDSEEVAQLCRQQNWPFRMTPSTLASGTDRLHAISQELPADIYINIQGDEPLITAGHIQALLAPFTDASVDATTLKVRCSADEVRNPNAVKVVAARDGRALYFSRSPIPYDRDGTIATEYWRHLGLYAYRHATLQRFSALPPGVLEQVEKLEQLRLLENGLSLHVSETLETTVGVDTEEDLARVDTILRQRAKDIVPARET